MLDVISMLLYDSVIYQINKSKCYGTAAKWINWKIHEFEFNWFDDAYVNLVS